MDPDKQKRLPLIRFPKWFTIALLAVTALAVTGLMFAIAPGSLWAFLKNLLQHPTLFLWNFLPVVIVLLLVFFISNNSPLACGVTAYVFLVFSVVNRIKTGLQEDPFVPTDLSLISECINIVKNYLDHYQLYIFLLFVAAPLAAVAVVLLFRDQRLRLRVRLTGIGVLVLGGIALNQLVYKNEALYNSYPLEGSFYFTVNHYNQKGWAYSFLKDLNFSKVQKPNGYSAASYQQKAADFAAADYSDTERPHIIMIMGEAFTDLSAYDVFDFTGYTDPLENFKKILADERTVSGHLIVPSYGGGTADTEFDVLTGCSTRHISGSLTSYAYIHQPVEALPSLLADQGYETLAIHPGDGWFYNRSNVYPHLGFSDFISLETGFDVETQNKGGYISDAACFEKVLSTFEEHLENSEDPLFSFTVTIQNHGPYDEKYLDQTTNFSTQVALTATEEATLSGYFEGIADTDDQLGQLVAYFDQLDEPVVLVFFGDHLPGFTGSMELFDKLGLPISWDGGVEERLNVYKTPWFIWKNDAAAALTADAAGVSLPENGLISSFYLGTLTAQLCGFTQLSPLFTFSNELREVLPVAASQSFMTSDGVFYEEAPAGTEDGLAQLEGWSYYQLFDAS